MRNALTAVIEAASDMHVVGMAADAFDALVLIPKLQPDIVIMDLMMSKMSGWDAIAALQANQEQIKIMVFGSVMDDEKILKVVQSGALRYVGKDAHREELIRAIRIIVAGEACLPPKIAGKLLNPPI